MKTGYVLYNLKAGYKMTREELDVIGLVYDDELKLVNIEDVKNYRVFLDGLSAEDYLVICGGDGTLNRFINNTEEIDFKNRVYYYPTGTGNDFATDMGHEKGCVPFEITEQIKNLPTVTVKEKSYRFINGVGYGIDGYCCQVGDEIKKTSDKKVNYTSVAIKGLLFHYKPTKAKVTVDGETYTYDKVWIAPTMLGRYYGGGMMPTPARDRNDKSSLSLMVLHGTGKLKTLIRFPGLFKGEHIKHTDMVHIHTGKEITVEFDRAVALQIDGETILGVTSYTARASEF